MSYRCFVLLGTGDSLHDVLVDEQDAWLLERYSWRVGTNGYVYRAEYSESGKRWFLLHRVITGATEYADRVDHADRNKLDNRRSNLRRCTHAQNMHNAKKPITVRACRATKEGPKTRGTRALRSTDS